MAVTQNTYTGNGSTVLYSFTFPYISESDVKVTINGTAYTNFIFSTATTLQFAAAPSNGAAIRIYRETSGDDLEATFYPGSAIRAQDLNKNFIQNLYVTQESDALSNTANTTANNALSSANTAISTANAAVSTANTASSNASSAVSTANTASSNASAAVSTANTAASQAAAAVSTANSASSAAASAVSTANTASSNASSAVSTANAASSSAASAVSTANAATTTANNALTAANNAVTTANTASSNASTAVSTANSAVSTANSAQSTANNAAAAVSNAVLFTLVNNVAAIPATPANNTYIEVVDSTGIESFTPLVGVPVGFVGDSGLTVRLRYTTAGTTWNYLSYFANNPETRYIGPNGGTITGQLRGSNSSSASTPGYAFNGDPDTGMGRPGANELALITGGVARLTFDPAGNAAFTGSVTIPAGSTVTGYLTTASAASTYLTQANASSTYQTQAGMSSYLTTTAAGTTYAPLASPTFTGTVTIPAGASIAGYLTTATAASTYLTQANASSTYQTQAGMSGYLATGAIGTTVQAYDANTAKTNAVQSFSAAQRGTYVTLTDAATVAIDLSQGNHFQVTLGGNRTIGAPTNVVAGQSGVIRLVQDGTGSRTASWNSVFKFPGGTAPTLTTTASAVDLVAYHCESATRIAARFIGDVK